MKKLLIAILFLGASKTYWQAEYLKIGNVLSEKYIMQTSPQYIVCGSGCFLPAYNVAIDEVDFNVGVSENYIIKFISTNDTDFMTKEKVKIGMKAKVVAEKSNQVLQYDNGFAWYIRLQSGWNAAIDYTDFNKKNVNTDSLMNNTTISFLYKK